MCLDDLQEGRREYIKQFEAVLNQTLNEYYAYQPSHTEAPAHCVALGAFAHGVHSHFGPPPVEIEWLGSLDGLMLAFQEIRKRVNAVWKTFTRAVNSQNPFPSKIIDIQFPNPGDELWEKAVPVWAGISGLHLEDYRPDEAGELLNVYGLLDSSTSGDWGVDGLVDSNTDGEWGVDS